MDEEKCGITEEELEWFKGEYSGITPCLEYGSCECCPWAESEVAK